MSEFALDRVGVFFVLLAVLPLTVCAAIWPERLLRVLSLGVRREFSRTQQLIIQAPAWVVLVGSIGLLVITAIVGWR